MKAFITFALVCFALYVALDGVSGQAAMPSQYYPDTSAARPRLWLKNDIARLQTVYADNTNAAANAYKHDLGKLLTYTSPDQDWRYESGWPCAALAMAWRITGTASYADKAINVFLTYFTGNPVVSGRLQSITHWGYCYDWLYDYSGFTSAMKTTLRNKIISWSDQEFQKDNDLNNPTYCAQDSDHMTASTTSHLVGGIAIYGDDPAAVHLLNRGWTGWTIGFNNYPGVLPNVSIETMYSVELGNGIPLPGWDYCFMSDCWDLANSWWAMDQLGYVNSKLKVWWANTLTNLIHNIDPANTHFRWLGDTQSTPYLIDYTGYIWSFTTNAIWNAERYGYTKQAAWGRYFLDNLYHPSYGISEGDTMLWFSRSYNSAATRINYKTDPSFPRYILGGLGTTQRMGYGYFRSNFTPQATWGGFAGVGNYLVDHMNNIHGSFFLWRNGEYFTTDPHQYGGETAGPIWNNLAIPIPAEPDFGGPIRYYNQGPAYMARGKITTKPDLFYAMLNADKSYNMPYNQWASCQVCRTPVKTYRRHFLYDGGDYAIIVDWASLATSTWTAWRIRTNGHTKVPTVFGSNKILNLPSDNGNYRTLVRVLHPSPANIHWTITDEVVADAAVYDYAFDPNHRGYAAAANTTVHTAGHIWITVLHLGRASDPTNQLNSAILLNDTNGAPIGAFFGNFSFITRNGDFTLPYSFKTHTATLKGSRILMADLPAPSCVQVTLSGVNVGGVQTVTPASKTILFNASKAGAQTYTVTAVTCPP